MFLHSGLQLFLSQKIYLPNILLIAEAKISVIKNSS